MIPTLVSAGTLRAYLQANWVSYSTSLSTIENYRAYLQSTTSSSSTNIYELERKRLAGLGYITGTINDQLGAFVNAQGFTGAGKSHAEACRKVLSVVAV